MNSLSGKNLTAGAVILFFLGLYLLLPCGFSSTDAYHYAAGIKHNTGLFHPFHLLYNAFGRVVCFFPMKAGVDTLTCLKAMNSVFAALALYMIMLILKLARKKEPETLLIAALCGSSFSVMRYATENETYIIPLFLGLASSYFFLKYLLNGKRSAGFFSVFFASLSVLFHLGYLFWWGSILAGFVILKDYKALLPGIAAALIIPAAYFLAVIITGDGAGDESFIEFAEGKSLSGLFSLSATGLMFSMISLARSFIQAHGYMFNMVKSNLTNLLPGLIAVGFFVAAMVRLKDIKQHSGNKIFVAIHVIIAVLMFIFALISDGNAEFMVMIPVLAFLVAGLSLKQGEKFYVLLLSGMIIWNLFYGLIPINMQSGKSEKYLCDILIRDEADVIARDKQQVAGMFFYFTGRQNSDNVYASPAVLKLSGKDLCMLRKAIDNSLAENRKIYTDCLSIMPLSRAVILEGEINRQYFSNYNLMEAMRWHENDGIRLVHRITGVKEQN